MSPAYKGSPPTTATATPHIRVDENLKKQAAETLDQRGLSLSDAGCIFLERVVVEEGLPPTRKIPNARTRAAIAEAGSMLESVRLTLKRSFNVSL